MQVQPVTASEQGTLRPVGEPLKFRAYVREMWNLRDFIVTVPLADLKAQHQNTLLGNVWFLLNPMLMAGIYYIVFGIIFNARRGVDNYIAFLVIGVLVFFFTNRVVMSGTRTILSNHRLIQSISFPRAALPVASTMTESITHVPAIIIMLLTALATGEPLRLAWLLVIPAFVLQAAFNLGLAMVAARFTFFFRDAQQLLPHLLRMWMYLSGVFFTADLVLARGGLTAARVFEANPLWIYMSLFREPLLGATPRLSIWVGAVAWSAVALALGFTFFRSRESSYSNA